MPAETSPTGNSLQSTTYLSVYTWLLTVMPKLRVLLCITLCCDVIVALLTILQCFLLSTFLARLFLHQLSSSQARALLWFLVATLGGHALFTGLRESLTQQSIIRMKAMLRQRVYAHLLGLGPAFVQHERTGELVAILSEGIERLDAYLNRYLPQLLLSMLIPLLILLVVFPLDMLSALLLLLTAPVIPLLMILVGSSAEKQTRLQWTALARMSAHFLDVVQGLPTLKLFGRAQAEQERVARISHAFREKTMATLHLAFLSGTVLDFLVAMAIGLVAVMLGVRLLAHGIALQQALVVLLLTPEFYQPLRELGVARHAGLEGKASAIRLREILNQPLPVQQPLVMGPLPAGSLEIAFHDVSYTYPDSAQAVLHHIKLTLPVGTCTALVGASGSGKSTLARLLLRYMACSRGDITVNGRSIAELPVELWRQYVAFVPQRPYLFCDTILENIRLARPAASAAEIDRAIELAGVHAFIQALPEGLATHIGEQGVRLSAGQAQRIAIARAFLKDAPLLILDEPTSSLDPESERALRQALASLIRGRTVLLIAHRLNTLAAASRVVVLEQGQLIEAGSPDVWLHRQGAYLFAQPERLGEEIWP